MAGRLTASTAALQGRYPTATTFSVVYDGPVDTAAVEAAFRIKPAVSGAFKASTGPAGGSTVTFVPTDGLVPDTSYTVTLLGDVRDGDGVATTPLAPLAVQTVPLAVAPAVVRFRPFAGSTEVPRGALLSVRFTARMDRSSTLAAFQATIGTKPLKGAVSWARRTPSWSSSRRPHCPMARRSSSALAPARPIGAATRSARPSRRPSSSPASPRRRSSEARSTSPTGRRSAPGRGLPSSCTT